MSVVAVPFGFVLAIPVTVAFLTVNGDVGWGASAQTW